MKTITDAINDRLFHLKNEKEMLSSRLTEATYNKYPELRRIDRDIFDVKTSRMICSIEHDTAPVAALNKREEDLQEERKKFLLDNNIPENFGEPQVRCDKCNDTGFTQTKDGKRVVCKICMKGALEEVFTESGLKDFGSYTLKSFEFDYFQDGKARQKTFNGIRDLIEGKKSDKLQLLTGGIQTGKTFLAVVSCKYAIARGFSSYYIKADSFGELSNSDIEEFKEYDIIFIDDYSADVTKIYKTATNLHNLLEARLASGKPTVIVSSSPLEILVSESDERVAGKLRLAGTL